MSAEVRTCLPHDDLARAAQLMWEGDCGAVPVIEADNYVVGMITDRDICMAAYTQGVPLHSIRVGDVMSREVKSLRPEEDASAITRGMKSIRVRRLPVVNALGRLVGIVSLTDLARRASQPKGPRERDVNLESVAELFASITRPWSAAEPSQPEPARTSPSVLVSAQRAR